MNADDKIRHVHVRFLQVVIPFGVALALALIFVLSSAAASAVGNPEWVQTDLFKFCVVVLLFGVPFIGFLVLIRTILLSMLSRR
jgi:hypothetical protein